MSNDAPLQRKKHGTLFNKHANKKWMTMDSKKSMHIYILSNETMN